MQLREKSTGIIVRPSVDWVAESMIRSGKYEKVEEAPKKKTTRKKKEE